MTRPSRPESPDLAERSPVDRLDSWKEIAVYLSRDVTTVQRWERREAMPVHRHLHDKQGSVHAFRTELDLWAQGRLGRQDGDSPTPGSLPPQQTEGETASDEAASVPASTHLVEHPEAVSNRRGRWRLWLVGASVLLAMIAALTIWQLRRDTSATLLSNARFQALTDFPGNAHGAALSRDGRFEIGRAHV